MTVRDLARLWSHQGRQTGVLNRTGEAAGGNAAATGGIGGAAIGLVPPPDWNVIPTRGTPKMSDDEFEQAIKDLARKEASQGILAGTKERQQLTREYISVVSPDRKAWFAGGTPSAVGTKGNPNKPQMHYNHSVGGWMWQGTPAENDRMARFNDIYRQAFADYEAEHGKVVGTPTVKYLNGSA